MPRVILILLIFLSMTSFADDQKSCSSIMLDLGKLGPIRNQSDVGWCYAFAAADMATYYLGKRISAVDIAAKFNSRNPVTGFLPSDPGLTGSRESSPWNGSIGTFEGGYIGAALIGANDRGFCTEALVRSENFPDFTKVDESLGQFTKAIFDFDRRLNNADGALTKETCSKGGVALRAIFPNGDIKAIIDILKRYDYDNSWRVMTDAVCRGRRSKFPQNFKVRVNKGDLDSQISDIDRSLNTRDIVGIHYDYYGLVHSSTGSWFSRLTSVQPGNHASTVIGRRFNASNGKCEYAIRNTAGTYCDPRFTREQCQNGVFWVSRTNLKSTLRAVNYIQK